MSEKTQSPYFKKVCAKLGIDQEDLKIKNKAYFWKQLGKQTEKDIINLHYDHYEKKRQYKLELVEKGIEQEIAQKKIKKSLSKKFSLTQYKKNTGPLKMSSSLGFFNTTSTPKNIPANKKFKPKKVWTQQKIMYIPEREPSKHNKPIQFSLKSKQIQKKKEIVQRQNQKQQKIRKLQYQTRLRQSIRNKKQLEKQQEKQHKKSKKLRDKRLKAAHEKLKIIQMKQKEELEKKQTQRLEKLKILQENRRKLRSNQQKRFKAKDKLFKRTIQTSKEIQITRRKQILQKIKRRQEKFSQLIKYFQTPNLKFISENYKKKQVQLQKLLQTQKQLKRRKIQQKILEDQNMVFQCQSQRKKQLQYKFQQQKLKYLDRLEEVQRVKKAFEYENQLKRKKINNQNAENTKLKKKKDRKSIQQRSSNQLSVQKPQNKQRSISYGNLNNLELTRAIELEHKKEQERRRAIRNASNPQQKQKLQRQISSEREKAAILMLDLIKQLS